MMTPMIERIPIWSQQIVLLMFISLLGIPHGALDHLVHLNSSPIRENKISLRSLVPFLAGYLLTMASYAALWWLSPLTGFAVFLAISAFHFAETDLLDDSGTAQGVTRMEQGFYGIMILAFLFIPHLPEVNAILGTWSALGHSLGLLDDFGKILPMIPWTLLVTWTAGQFLRRKQAAVGIISQTWVIAIVVSFLPLLPAFTFYFAIWHSSISLQAIYAYLNEHSRCTPRQMVMKALPLSLLSLSAIGILIALGMMKIDFPRILLGTLISISILTLPHMAIMNTMYRRSSKPEPLGTGPVRLSSSANH